MTEPIAAMSITDFPPPPRSVRIRPGEAGRIWMMRLFSIPFVIAGCFMICLLLRGPITRAIGREVPARYEEVKPHHRAKDDRHFSVTFSYQARHNDREIGYGTIDTEGAAPPAVGSMTSAKVLSIGPWDYVTLSARERDRNWTSFCCVGLFFLVWCSLAAFLAFAAWAGPMFERQLIRDGIAVTGHITAKDIRQRSKGKACELTYDYRVEGEADVRIHKVSTDLTAGEKFVQGQIVTVLYDPKSPRFSTIYEVSDFQVG